MSWGCYEPSSSSNFDKMFNPPDLHELCACEDCCGAGEHVEIEQWAKDGCLVCVERLEVVVASKEYCLSHHSWYCDERTDGFCHEHGAINGGGSCTQHYLEA